MAEAPTSTPLINNSFLLEVAVCDGRVLVAIFKQQELTCEVDFDHAVAETSIALGARDGYVSAGKLEIWRDVYYLNPDGRPEDWETDQPLGEGEYLLLGDNPPNSADSRQYGPISRAAMVGSVQSRDE